ncbi:MAG TPA: RDD family protein [Thermoanaerobaculia bacterium]|nr:RDD family protein [Thermoanaerobaculia bacterium]
MASRTAAGAFRGVPAVPEDLTARDFSLVLLRAGAFLIDALVSAMLLLPPAAAVSYSFVWVGGPIGRIGIVWWVALGLFLMGLLLRDVPRRRSLGKRIMALRIRTDGNRDLGRGLSIVRNLPLVVPGWNLIELALVLFSREGRRTGDRMTRASVVEE